MKKIVAICLVLFVCIGVVGCNKKEAKPTLAKPTLSSAMAIFNDMSASYDDKMYPYEFTEAELAAADEDTLKQIGALYEKVRTETTLVSKYDYTKLDVINAMLRIDYAFRPAFLHDSECFSQSILTIEDYIVDTEDMQNPRPTALTSYILFVKPDDFTDDMSQCAVPVLRKIVPDITQTEKYKTREEAVSAFKVYHGYSNLISQILLQVNDKDAIESFSVEVNKTLKKWVAFVKSFPDE